MLGLSCTGVGMRPIETCVEIYNKLQSELNLQYFELAIGTQITTDVKFNMPLVLHDLCLYTKENDRLRRLNYLKYLDDVYVIKEFCENNNVQAISLHSENKSCEVSIVKFDKKIKQIEKILGVPLYVETMYKESDWYNYDDLMNGNRCQSKLLIDVSHVNIWTHNNPTHTEDIVCALLNKYEVGSIHLSSNNGSRDSHDLIKPDTWFLKYLDEWSDKYLVTWESLPTQFAYYERLDKGSKFEKLGVTF
jgi:predicted DNA-binding protein YlxM (UPF0122 family)